MCAPFLGVSEKGSAIKTERKPPANLSFGEFDEIFRLTVAPMPNP
jgi:hypothetical protein